MKVALFNLSPRVADAEANIMAQAWAEQQNSIVARVWGLVDRYEIDFCGSDRDAALAAAPPPGFDARHLILAADSAVEGEGLLGDHAVDASGAPILRTYDDALDYGGTVLGERDHLNAPSVSSTGSHESCEARLNPGIAVWVPLPDGALHSVSGSSVPREVSDPVEGESALWTLSDGTEVAVSDFVGPAWFLAGSSGPWSWRGAAPGPFQLAPGGYANVRGSDGTVSPIFADRASAWTRARRRSGRFSWRK